MNSPDSSSASPFPSTEDLELLRYLVGDTDISPDIQPVLRKRPGTSVPVLSFAQERLWFLTQFEPDKPLYNVRLMAYLHGTLNSSALSASLLEIIRRHEVLRTTFHMEGYEPVQRIHTSLEIRFPFIDLSGLSPVKQEQYLRQLASIETQKVFDLARGPLLRGMVLQLNPQKHLLILTLHHIIADGWSMGVLLQELHTHYSGFVEGRNLPLAELPLQYADFACWQRQTLQGDRLSRLLTYWRTQLAGAAPLLPLPTDHPRPARQSYAGAVLELPLSPALTAHLKALSQREGVTIFMTLLAAFQILLARYSGCEDILVGTPIANRTHKELEGIIGFFVNTLVLRTDLSGNPRVRQVLQRVRDVALQAYAHQDLPFERLVEELQPERNLSYHPLFQVLFQFDNTPLSSLTLPQLSLEPLNLEKETTLFDLHLLLFETEQGLTAHFEYNTNLFEVATIQRMAGHFQVLLESLIRDSEQSIGELPLLSDAEQEQLLMAWNETHSPYPARPLHSFFEEEAQRNPLSVAVLFKGQELSYLELNKQANRLAHRLRHSGIGPDVPVGLYVERSLEMLIGILGILKAGGVYVPLDPSYPLQRLSYMVNDAQAPLLLTHAPLLNRLPECQAQVLLIEEAMETTDEDNPVTKVTPEHLAYIIYTSGSTGKPKGVCLPHRALTNLL
ncbi:MAG TPA: condensation domain-containing protein, partial [Ktedonobacteraceae bacterium]|nr:condensation domain-containing protein [Ktedonobacteraceae bacterium]